MPATSSSMPTTAIITPGSIRLAAQEHPYLRIIGTSRLLQAEIVVELLVGQVPALDREVVASLLQTVGETQVVRELGWHHLFAIFRAQALRIEREAVLIIVVVGEAQLISLRQAVVPIEGEV